MNKLLKLAVPALATAALLAFSSVATATPFQIPGPNQDISKNGTGILGGNSNNAANNLFRLQTYGVDPYNLANPGSPLPTPLLAGSLDLASNDQSAANSLSGFDYAVLHYGVGPGGIGGGGGVAFYYLNGMTSFLFPATGLGPNGNGGFSTLTLFTSTNGAPRGVPDGGMTVMLLGAALAGLGTMRRFMKR